jgi:hypothetical protein
MKCVNKSLASFVIIICVLIANLVYAKESAKEPAQVKIQQVALFKNGLGFFISQVECPDKQTSFVVIPEAAPSHGAFWVAYPEKVKLKSLIARQIEQQESRQAVSIEELLKSNVGKKVLLSLDDKGESSISGVISYFPEPPQPQQPNPYAPNPYYAPLSSRYESYSGVMPVQPASLMIVRTDSGDVAINPHMVKTAKFSDKEINNDFSYKLKSIQLEIRMASPAKGEKLTLTYLAKGITWAPSYTVDITNDGNASISAKADVINEICDLNNVTLQLVTGFPNLQFADVVSPLAMKESLAQFLAALSRGQSERGREAGYLSNVMVQSQSVARTSYEDRDRTLMPAYGAAEVGMTAEDLFFYPLEKVNLAKGQVGYYPLFTQSVGYKHIYQWDIPDYVNFEDRYSYSYNDRQRQQGKEPQETVWHCLRLENSTNTPWTTAPAIITKDGFILGQDALNYTPPKAKTTLKITQAVNIKAEQLELESARKQDASQLYGHHYDLITIEGKLSVINSQDKPISLEIGKTLSGEVKSSEPQAKVESLARGLSRMNAVRKLTWTIELAPNESKQLSYTYDVYVQR